MSTNGVLALDDPGCAWKVVAGAIDVFAARPGESWRPLFTAETGTTIVGLPRGKRGLVVHGRPQPGALVEPAELEGQLDAESLDAGLLGLVSAIQRGLPPRDFEPLEAGERVEVAAGSVVRTTELVWVRPEEGSVRALGRETSRSITGEAFTLVDRNDWLDTDTDAVLRAVRTSELIRSGDLAAGLRRFQEQVIDVLEVKVARLKESELAAIRERHLRTEEVARDVARELAALLEPRHALGLAGEQRAPLLAATRLACAELGVEIGEGENLDDIARRSGLFIREVALEGDWWRDDLGPLVAFTAAEDGAEPAPVALTRARGGYKLHDPATGAVQRLDRAARERLETQAVMFYPSLPETPLTGVGLLRFGLHGVGRDLGFVLGATLLIAVIGLLVPILTSTILGTLIPAGQETQIVELSLLLLASAAVVAVLSVAQSLVAVRVQTRLEGSIQPAVWARLMELPSSLHRRFSTGELATTILTPRIVSELLGPIWLRLVFAGIVGVANLTLILFYDVRLWLIAVALVAICAAVTGVALRAQIRHEREIYSLRKELNSRAFQLVGHVSKLRVAAAEERAFAYWGSAFAASRRATFASRLVQNRLAAFNAVILLAALIAGFLVAGKLVDGIGVTDFVAFNVALTQVVASLLVLSSALVGVLSLAPPLRELTALVRNQPEVDEERDDPGELRGDIDLVNVSHSYSADGPLVLDDVSLSIRSGEFVAIVGPSGSGKSTVMRLLLGFEQPISGSVLYDERELAELDIRAVRRNCGVVLQDGQLLAGDILSNIIGTGTFTIHDAWEAAEAVGLDEDIKAMPMGMHTLISEGGGALSGGQRQRIMLARAIVSRPRILMLDEATSALDNRTQQIVTDSMRRLNATRVVIAHRLSTIREADRIVVIEAGRVVQSGNYDELMAVPGKFRELAERQLV